MQIYENTPNPAVYEAPVVLAQAESLFQVLSSQYPLLVMLSTQSCGHCHALMPQLPQLIQQLAMQSRHIQVAVIKIDADAVAFTSKYGFQTVPTFMLFAGGNLVSGHEGALTIQQLQQWVLQSLA